MNHKRPQNILVTGSTADIGTELIHVLGTTYRNKFNVIGGVHKHADSSALRPHCKAIVPLDYDQLATVEAALTDIDYLFFVPVHSRQRAQLAQDVIKIAKQKRIKYVVLVSLLGCESRIGVFCSQFKEIEDSFVASGIPLTILRCSPLQQNMMAMQGNFREQIGTITMPIGTGGYSPIHVKDVAKAAAALFCHPSEHYGKTYRITGPEILSGVGIAGKASLGLNRPVRFRNCTLDEARKAMMAAISPEWVIEGFTELYDLIAQGYFATLSPDLALLTFDKGVTVAEFFRENTALFNGETDSKSAGNELVFPSKL